ncbi:MAG: ribonuclease III [Magnetococcales bacterium]|nr:ribonuclease III [Magnetococcales bacterium]MBF0323408.1 ribonuclease III [Magnetococcales bacterium]
MQLDVLQDRIGYRFLNQSLLHQALRHRSSLLPEGEGDLPVGSQWHNERLEFLGDAVLSLLISDLLFTRFPDLAEGALSRWRATLVNTDALSHLGREMGLGNCLQMGHGEELSGGREKNSILGNAMEALLGAIYLDGGHAAAQRVVNRMFADAIAAIRPERPGKDCKSLLQEKLQSLGRPLPVYRVIQAEGAPHQRIFTIECVADGLPPRRGQGQTKRTAEREAARRMLELWPDTSHGEALTPSGESFPT